MAIQFLNTVNLNKNQLNNAAIQNLAADPGGAVEGQIYFNTVDFDLKIFANGAWKEVGATSGVETLSTTQAGNSTGNTLTVLTNAVGDVTINSFAYAGGSNIGYVPSGGTVDQYLDGAGNWIDITTGDIESVNASTVNNRLGIAITTPLGPDPVVGLDIIGQTNLGTTPATDDELIIYDTSTTTNKSITVENLVGGYETTYTLDVPAGTANINLKGTDGAGTVTNDAITLSGFTGQTVTNHITTSNIQVALTPSVVIANDLSLTSGRFKQLAGGTNEFAGPIDLGTSGVNQKLLRVADGAAATDGVNLGQVESLVAGLGSFQGGYDATNNPGTPALTGSSNVAIGNGDFYVVTAPGVITFSDTPTGDATLEVGDFIFANTNIAINSNPPSTSFTLVIADANIAGVGATDGATEKGVAGFDSAHFTATVNGWIQLKERTNPNGRKQSLNNTAPSSRAEAGGVTTFTLDLANSILFDTGALSEDVAIEVTEGAAPYETVYAHVNRSGSASMTVAFTGSVANDAYQVLLTYVGQSLSLIHI